MYIGVIGIKKLRKATLISRIEKKYDFFIKLNIFLEYSFFTHMVTAFNHIIFVFFFMIKSPTGHPNLYLIRKIVSYGST